MKRTPTHNSWSQMKQRCADRGHHAYADYGGRGITVCDRWINSFETFLADMGERPEGMTLDRIDTNGDYSPENCRWATHREQARNKRNAVMLTIDGQTLNLSAWLEAGYTLTRLLNMLNEENGRLRVELDATRQGRPQPCTSAAMADARTPGQG